MKHGLPPILWPHARILILGSLPGDESLRRQQYYGNPRNQFWAILARIFESPMPEEYPHKLDFLKTHGIALWDVLERAERHGSLDSNIRNATPNNFEPVFAQLPQLRTIAVNGSKAASSFVRYVQPQFAQQLASLRVLALPSTSPVPSRKFLTLDAKAEIWRAITLP
jgi:TDG/mug DNA glycosylase family protein